MIFKVLDFIAEYAELFGKEWFRIMEWLLVISALQTVAMLSKNKFIALLPIISICVLWTYVFFGYGQKYFYSLKPVTGRGNIKEIITRGLIATVIGSLLFIIADQIANIAIEIVSAIPNVPKESR